MGSQQPLVIPQQTFYDPLLPIQGLRNFHISDVVEEPFIHNPHTHTSIHTKQEKWSEYRLFFHNSHFHTTHILFHLLPIRIHYMKKGKRIIQLTYCITIISESHIFGNGKIDLPRFLLALYIHTHTHNTHVSTFPSTNHKSFYYI